MIRISQEIHRSYPLGISPHIEGCYLKWQLGFILLSDHFAVGFTFIVCLSSSMCSLHTVGSSVPSVKDCQHMEGGWGGCRSRACAVPAALERDAEA